MILKQGCNVLLDFSHVYPAGIEDYVKHLSRIDLSDIEGTDMYCTKEAEAEIKKRLCGVGPQGIHFIDSGNYHYVTKFFAGKIEVPFSQFAEDTRINSITNRILYYFLSGSFLMFQNSD